MLRGHKGTIFFAPSGNKVEFKPERIFSEEIEAADFFDPMKTDDIPRLEKNFFDCIRSGATPLANVDLAVRTQTVLCLAEQSERMSMTLLFEEKTRTIKSGDGKVIPPMGYDSPPPQRG